MSCRIYFNISRNSWKINSYLKKIQHSKVGAAANTKTLFVTLQFPSIQWGIMADTREKGLQDYRKKLLEHKEIDGRLKECKRLFNVVDYSVATISCLFWLDIINSIGWCLLASDSWPASYCFVMQLASLIEMNGSDAKPVNASCANLAYWY